MKIVHIIPSVGLQSFGLGPVALNLAREQLALGEDSEIWCLDSEKDRLWAADSSGLPANRIRSFSYTGPAIMRLSLDMERAADSCRQEAISVVHQHGIWSGISRATRIVRKTHHVPSVISPHGMLERWALKKSRWKKLLALAFYERANLQNASCLHACSEREAVGFREFGLKNPIAVIPNGVDAAWLHSSGNAQVFRARFDIPQGKRVMLFLSRIAPVKGLPLLLEALAMIRERLDGWVLVIAGADESGHEKEVRELIARLGLEQQVRFVGLLTEQAKRDAFAAADLFVLPTHGENFSIVVIEALGAGVPVLTTKGAPWQDLVKHRCGWWADTNADALTRELGRALDLPSQELRDMGMRGKDLVSASYTWVRSAQMSKDLCEWLLGQRSKPAFVVCN